MRNMFVPAFVALLHLSLLAPSRALAADHPASHCEVFVDRVGAYRSSHAHRSLFFFIKTLNWRLDGPITSIGFHGRMLLPNGATCPSTDYACQADVNVWKDYPASAYNGASDYFLLDLLLGNDFRAQRYYEGAFYVQTPYNRFWVNPAGGGNFFLDSNMHTNVEAAFGAPAYSQTPSSSINTADRFPYLNPGFCR